ncbi:MAG: hypothetical protein O3C62_03050 [Actinomycetota bacterium]|nr:hypothetical protein [Actinomycetota bacterium]MDA2970747.1 hypothetical protein [Actinomycetota bacterium]MDA3000641.1 hypothetical protein [Actinomycetota bacterium]
MNEDRVQAFTDEIGEMKLRGAKGDRERILLVVGALAIVVGVVLAVLGGFQASGTSDLGDQVAFLATGTLIGLALVIAGTALFIRYSMARFMRFWLVRLVHEHRSETDRLIAAIEKNRGS